MAVASRAVARTATLPTFNAQKFLDLVVKVASLIVTAPATWVVAGELFSDVSSPFRMVVQISAVVLIEGVLLSNWLLLEANKTAPAAIKARYALTALGMYIALLVVAWQHEGPQGIVFRFALLAALLGSGWDTYVETWQVVTKNVDRSEDNAPRVRREKRKQGVAVRIEEIRVSATDKILDIKMMAEIKAEERKLRRERLLAEVRAEDRAVKSKISQPAPIVERPALARQQPRRMAITARSAHSDEDIKREIARMMADGMSSSEMEKRVPVGRTKFFKLKGEVESTTIHPVA